MNKVILTGNITKDLEIQKSGETTILKFNIAVKRDKNTVEFIPIVVFGKQAEATAKYCKKGNKILVNGSLKLNYYEDKDNVKKLSVGVIADNYNGIEFLGASKQVNIDENLFCNE